MLERFIKILLVGTALFSVGFGAIAFAADDPSYGLDTAAGRANLPKTVAGEGTVPGIAGKVVQLGLSLIGIIFFIIVLYAGFLWMSAMGNTEKAESAKAILEAAVIGLTLVLGAYAITNFVFSSLGGTPAAVVPPPGNAGNYVCKIDADCNAGFKCVANICQ